MCQSKLSYNSDYLLSTWISQYYVIDYWLVEALGERRIDVYSVCAGNSVER